MSKDIKTTVNTLNDITSPWEFVENFLPNYHESDEVAESNDLDVIISNETMEGSCAANKYNEIADSLNCKHYSDFNAPDPIVIAEAKRQLDEVNAYLYETAIENFLKIFNT